MYYILCKKKNITHKLQIVTLKENYLMIVVAESSEMDQKRLQINLKIFARNVTKRFTTLFVVG